jgi:hypothetical protein
VDIQLEEDYLSNLTLIKKKADTSLGKFKRDEDITSKNVEIKKEIDVEKIEERF